MEWAKELYARSVGPVLMTDGGVLPTNDTGKGNMAEFLKDNLLPQVVNFILGAALTVAVLMIIVGGFMFIFSGGDQEKKTKGRDIIIWAFVGVGVVVFSFGMIKIIT
ncbi:MAG TPA: hypothetical protein VIT68_04910, partial [Candidatus Gracilibacteria bacterium]